MAIEYRNGKAYYYRKIRRDGKVISEYVGNGEITQILALQKQQERNDQKAQQLVYRKKQALHNQADAELLNLEQNLNEIFTAVAIACGYHKHKRQWRKKRPIR